MPFAGSATMAALLHQLSNVNDFNFMTIDKPDTMSNDKMVADVFEKTGANGCPDGFDDNKSLDENPKPMQPDYNLECRELSLSTSWSDFFNSVALGLL